MPKRLPRAQHPTSRGLAGAASADQTWSASFPSVEGAALDSRVDAAVVTQTCLNGLDKSAPGSKTPCACWTHELDDFLRQSAQTHKDHERRSIETIRSIHPGIPKKVIWERIVYLGLTERTRPPYDAHEWTQVEDDILRAVRV